MTFQSLQIFNIYKNPPSNGDSMSGITIGNNFNYNSLDKIVVKVNILTNAYYYELHIRGCDCLITDTIDISSVLKNNIRIEGDTFRYKDIEHLPLLSVEDINSFSVKNFIATAPFYADTYIDDLIYKFRFKNYNDFYRSLFTEKISVFHTNSTGYSSNKIAPDYLSNPVDFEPSSKNQFPIVRVFYNSIIKEYLFGVKYNNNPPIYSNSYYSNNNTEFIGLRIFYKGVYYTPVLNNINSCNCEFSISHFIASNRFDPSVSFIVKVLNSTFSHTDYSKFEDSILQFLPKLNSNLNVKEVTLPNNVTVRLNRDYIYVYEVCIDDYTLFSFKPFDSANGEVNYYGTSFQYKGNEFKPLLSYDFDSNSYIIDEVVPINVQDGSLDKIAFSLSLYIIKYHGIRYEGFDIFYRDNIVDDAHLSLLVDCIFYSSCERKFKAITKDGCHLTLTKDLMVTALRLGYDFEGSPLTYEGVTYTPVLHVTSSSFYNIDDINILYLKSSSNSVSTVNVKNFILNSIKSKILPTSCSGDKLSPCLRVFDFVDFYI